MPGELPVIVDDSKTGEVYGCFVLDTHRCVVTYQHGWVPPQTIAAYKAWKCEPAVRT